MHPLETGQVHLRRCAEADLAYSSWRFSRAEHVCFFKSGLAGFETIRFFLSCAARPQATKYFAGLAEKRQLHLKGSHNLAPMTTQGDDETLSIGHRQLFIMPMI
jgi:hypothetical protein